jgi:hypothetical protein
MKDPEEDLALIHSQKLSLATHNPEPPRWIELSQRLMDNLDWMSCFGSTNDL